MLPKTYSCLKHIIRDSNLNYLNKCHLGTSSLSNQTNVINLSYDSNDKFNSKSALVIAHGLFASKASWRAMARRINDATKQRVYTVDMRNHGNSVPYVDSMTYLDMAGDLESFINRIVVEKDKCECVTMMGHSMGGKSTMALVLSDKLNPKNLDKIIVADIAPSTSPSLLNISKILEKLCTIDLSEVSSNLFAARKEIDAKLCEVDVLKNDMNQRQFILTRLIEANGKIVWGFNLPAIKTHVQDIMGFPIFTKKYNKPALFVGGELSNYLSEQDRPHIEQLFSDFRFSTIPKAGHVIHFDNPTDTINEIKNFIN